MAWIPTGEQQTENEKREQIGRYLEHFDTELQEVIRNGNKR